MSGLLIDHSVWARLPTSAVVAAAFRALVNLVPAEEILICPPIVAEVGVSARTPEDHAAVMQALLACRDCPISPDTRVTLAVQNALWSNGLLRAAGPVDTLIAAYAIVNDATVIHYDRDFEHVAAATGTLKQRWIVPAGTA